MSDVVATGILNIVAEVNTAQLDKALQGSTASITAQATKAADSINNNFSKSFKGVETASNSLVNKISKGLSNALSSIGTTFKVFGGVATAAIAGVLGESIKLGVSLNELLASSRAAFTSLTGSATVAGALLEKVNQTAEANPFLSKDVFLSSTRNLLAFGFAAKDIPGVLTAAATAAGALGTGSAGVQTLVEVLGRVKETGTLGTRQLVALANAGVNATAIIAQQLGKSQDQVRAGITAGTITGKQASDALIRGMTAQFGPVADQFSKTLPGAVAIFKNSLADIGSTLTKAFVNPAGGGAAVTLFTDLAAIIQHLKEVIIPFEPILQGFANGLASAADSAKNFISSIGINQVQDFVNVLKDLAPVLLAAGGAATVTLAKFLGIIPGLGSLAAAFESVSPLIVALVGFSVALPTVRNAVVSISQALIGVLAPAAATIAPAIRDLVEIIKNFVSRFASGFAKGFIGDFQALAPAIQLAAVGFSGLIEAVGRILHVLGPLAPLLGAVAGGLAAGALALKAYAIAVGIYEEAVAAATAIQTAFDVALDANPIGVAILAIAALAGGVIYLYEHFTPVLNVINAVGSAIKSGFVAAFNVAKAAIDPLVGAFEKVINVGKAVFSALAPVRGLLLVLAAPIVVAVVPLIALVEAFRLIISVAPAVVSAVRDFISSIVNSGAVKTALNAISTAFKDIKNFVLDVASKIASVFKVIGSFVADAASKVIDFIKSAADLPGVQTAFDLIKGAVDFLNKALDKTVGLIKDVVSFGAQAIKFATGGVIDLTGGGPSKPKAPAPPKATPEPILATGADAILANAQQVSQGIQASISAAIKPIDDLLGGYNAVKTAAQAVKDANLSLAEIERTRTLLLKDIVARENEVLQANLKVVDAQIALRDLQQQRAEAVRTESERERNFAQEEAGFSDKLLQNQIDQRAAAQSLVDAQRQLNFLTRQRAISPQGLNLAGLSIDEARRRIAGATQSLQNQQVNNQQGSLTRQVAEATDAVTSAQIKTRDTTRQTVDLQQNNADAIHANDIALRDFAQSTARFNEDTQKAQEAIAVAIDDQGKLQRGEIGTKESLRQLDIQRAAAQRTVTNAVIDEKIAQDQLAVTLANQSGSVADQVKANKNLLDDKIKQAAPNGPDAALLSLYTQQRAQLDGILGDWQAINDTNRRGAVFADITGELENAKKIIDSIKTTPIVRQSEQATLVSILNQAKPFIQNAQGNPAGLALTPDQISGIASDSLDALIKNPSSNVNQILKDILAKIGLNIPGFKLGGVFDTETVARIGEAGREVVLPLTRQANLQDLLSRPEVLSPILAALPRITLPQNLTVNTNSANAITAGYGSGGPSNANARIEQSASEDRMAEKFADALVRKLKNNDLGKNEVNVPITIQPHRLQNESDIANSVAREIMRRLR